MNGTAGLDSWFKFGSSVIASELFPVPHTASLTGVTGAIPRETVIETSKAMTTCIQDGTSGQRRRRRLQVGSTTNWARWLAGRPRRFVTGVSML